MYNRSRCALCAVRITPEIDSGEHILLQALGGRKEVTGFICRPCNSRAGDCWDVELTKQLAHVSIMHGVDRQRSGELPSLKVKTTDGGELLLHADGSMTPATVSFNKVKTETGWSILAVARTMSEAEKIVQGVARRYPNSNAMDALGSLSVRTEYNKQPLTFTLQVGGHRAGRSIVKTAVAMAHSMGIGHRDCPLAMRYLLGDDAPQYGHFHERDLIAVRPASHLIHCVSVKGDSARRILLGYVEYFSLARLVILLSDDYDGPTVQCTYAIDPSTGAELPVDVDLDLSQQEIQEILTCTEDSPASYIRTINQAFPVLMRRSEERARVQAIKAAFDYAGEKLGIKVGNEIESHQFQQFSAYFAEHIVSYVMASRQQDSKLRPLGNE